MNKIMRHITLFSFIFLLSGCGNQTVSNNNISNTPTVTSKPNKISDVKSIPFNYAFTGFVSVKDYNDLPIGIKTFNTQEEWTEFVSKCFPYNDIPLPVYSGGIDFTKDSLIYYSIGDAKGDFYAKAWQIDRITLENQQLNITTKQLDGNLTITANNADITYRHRYVILATIEKQYLKNIK